MVQDEDIVQMMVSIAIRAPCQVLISRLTVAPGFLLWNAAPGLHTPGSRCAAGCPGHCLQTAPLLAAAEPEQPWNVRLDEAEWGAALTDRLVPKDDQ